MSSDSSRTQKDSALEGRYTNYLQVGHNAYEFFLDFGQILTETEEAELYARFVTSPGHAKAMLQTLKEAIDNYEQNFGHIID
jgi:hypothetical protein